MADFARERRRGGGISKRRIGRACIATALLPAVTGLGILRLVLRLGLLSLCLLLIGRGATPRAQSLSGSSSTGSAVVPDAEASALHLGASAGWRFEPLGPEGAEILQLCPLAAQRWAARSAHGELYFWEPPEGSFGEGAWRSVPLPDAQEASSVLLMTSLLDGQLALLASDGRVLSWDPACVAEVHGAPANEGKGSADAEGEAAAAESLSVLEAWRRLRQDPARELEAAAAARPAPARRSHASGSEPGSTGAFRVVGSVSRETARTVVAMLPASSAGATLALLITRQGEFHEIGHGLRSEWIARRGTDGTALTETPRPWEMGFQLRSAFAHPQRPSRVHVLTAWEGLFVSEDGGRTFVPAGGGLPKEIRTAATGAEAGLLVAASQDGLHRSCDGGRTWTQTGHACPGRNPYAELAALAADPARACVLHAVTRDGCLMCSRDEGSSWERQLPGLLATIHEFAVADGEILLATSRGVLASSDRGSSWQWRNRGLRQVSVLSLMVDPSSPGRILSGTDLGLYVHESAAEGNRAGSASLLALLAPHFPDDLLADAASMDPEVRARVSRPVSVIASGTLAYATPAMSGAPALAFGGDRGVVLRVPQEAGDRVGGRWRALGAGRATSALVFAPDGVLWAAGREAGRIWVAHWNGDAWIDARPEALVSEEGELGGAFPVLAVAPTSTAGPAVHLLAGALWRRMADGWQRMALPGPEPLTIAGGFTGLWLGTESGLFRRQAGSDWIGSGLPGERVLGILPALSGSVAARTSAAVYWSPDEGHTWEPVPLPSALRALSMAMPAEGGRLYLGTARFGLFSVELPLPEAFVGRPLAVEAHPNPFQESVLLRCPLIPGAAGSQGDQVSPPPAGEPAGKAGFREVGPPMVGPERADGTMGPEIPTPARGSADAGFAAILDGTADPEICIFTVHGQLIRRLRGADLVGDGFDRSAAQWIWDGRTAQGLPAPSGMYVVSTKLGSQRYVGKIIKLR